MSGGPDGTDERASARSTFLIVLACVALLALPVLGFWLLPIPHAARAAATAAPAPATLATAARRTTPRATPAPSAQPPADEPASERSVGGVVLDPDGRPAAEAFVECVGGADEAVKHTRTTDAEGRFVLPPEAAGCRATAHAPTSEPSDPVVLAAGMGNVLRLARAGGISGIVVDEAGAPVPSFWIGVESFVAKDGESEVSAGGRTRKVDSPDGTFTLEGLFAGRYVLSAASEGLPPGKSDGVDVERGRVTPYARIVLARGATLTGVVTDAQTGRPIAGAAVALDAFSGVGYAANRGVVLAITDAAGAFTLEGIPSGVFSVKVDAASYRQKIATGLDTHGGRALRQDLALTPQDDGGARSELTGIGAMLAPSPKGVMVAGIVAGGPAEKGGLERGDRIERIDGAGAGDLTVGDAIQRLRGPEGTRVTVVVNRDGSGPVEVTLVRDTIVR
jgi:hypothetical protein